MLDILVFPISKIDPRTWSVMSPVLQRLIPQLGRALRETPLLRTAEWSPPHLLLTIARAVVGLHSVPRAWVCVLCSSVKAEHKAGVTRVSRGDLRLAHGNTKFGNILLLHLYMMSFSLGEDLGSSWHGLCFGLDGALLAGNPQHFCPNPPNKSGTFLSCSLNRREWFGVPVAQKTWCQNPRLWGKPAGCWSQEVPSALTAPGQSVSSNFSQIFPFLMKFLLCAQRKIEFFELENCPLCVFLLGISYSEQPCVVLELPKAESVVVLKGRQQFSIHLQF